MTKSALNSDLAVSARAAGAAAPAAEQLDFLAPVAERISSIDPEAIAANAADERKRGRPKGAENLSSRQLREMLVRAGGHPLIHLARWGIGDQAINAGIGVSAGGSPPWLAAYRDAEGRIIEGVEIQGVSRSGADGTDQEGGS